MSAGSKTDPPYEDLFVIPGFDPESIIITRAQSKHKQGADVDICRPHNMPDTKMAGPKTDPPYED